MGWYGEWDIKYSGKDPELFQNLAKLEIPNFKERFEVSANGRTLECQRPLSWYTADIDLEQLTLYLHDGDKLLVSIDGDTHPYDENGRKLGQEDMTFRKENGEVIIEQEYVDKNRYRDKMSQLTEDFQDFSDEYEEWIKSELMENGKIKENIREAYFDAVEKFAGKNKERFRNIEGERLAGEQSFDDLLKGAQKQAAKQKGKTQHKEKSFER